MRKWTLPCGPVSLSWKNGCKCFWMVSLGVSESGCGIKACESFWKKERGQEDAGCTVSAPASFRDVFETEDLACGSGERTRFSLSVGNSTADSYSGYMLSVPHQISAKRGCGSLFWKLPVSYETCQVPLFPLNPASLYFLLWWLQSLELVGRLLDWKDLPLFSLSLAWLIV